MGEEELVFWKCPKCGAEYGEDANLLYGGCNRCYSISALMKTQVRKVE